jgi:hypothetical protein
MNLAGSSANEVVWQEETQAQNNKAHQLQKVKKIQFVFSTATRPTFNDLFWRTDN